MPREWLAQLRVQAEKTHEDVASAVDVSRQYYGMIESGIRNPSVELAKKIGAVLNFEWTLFFADQGNEMFPDNQSTKDTA
ncbi:transcriptional regulator [Paenibacillus antibioticophila]|uniref:Transcriptional regulator n=1 Tax=Paenibacillus antibioticophila TaxID=1274374 RepID=A0A919XTU2_9BACL|nr:helix-turn-helix transcriptional regulator [Paenibacillus antibioticophila]GIO36258.1 transcriptional regulator [Paenibacillus antibioticophila]